MWKILQKKTPRLVIATGKQYSVKFFLSLVAKELKLKILWKKGINEKGYVNDKLFTSIDKRYFRPTSKSLLGKSNLAEELNWKPIYNIESLVKDMVSSELKKL